MKWPKRSFASTQSTSRFTTITTILRPREIAERRKYENLTQLWLAEDHYKWRAMRVCGVDERYITGSASEYEKFQKWAEVMPQLAGCRCITGRIWNCSAISKSTRR